MGERAARTLRKIINQWETISEQLAYLYRIGQSSESIDNSAKCRRLDCYRNTARNEQRPQDTNNVNHFHNSHLIIYIRKLLS